MQAFAFIARGLMTAAFGILLGRTAGRVAGVGAALLIVRGVARATAGVFVPDPLDHAITPSFDEQIHNAAGLVYVTTLIVAVVVWMIASVTRSKPSIWFPAYSLVTVVAAIAAPPVLIAAGLATGADVGLFQRAMLGVLNAWLLAFAGVTLFDGRHRPTVLASARALTSALHDRDRVRRELRCYDRARCTRRSPALFARCRLTHR